MHATAARGWRGLCLIATVWVGAGSSAFAHQAPGALPDQPPGTEVLTTGPVHEAFAEPIVYDPKAGPIIPKIPPAPVPEMPPDVKPVGDNVQWLPGYWSWDDGRKDFIWVSGLWRAIPPGRQWTPGYWTQAEGGYQWVPGAWTPAGQAQQQYLPAPPASLDSGPSSPAPSDDVTWAPGTWIWQDSGYAWRPGYWAPVRPDWMWIPAHYVWTPSGYLFVDGYWDHPLAQRGTLFAPVYFNQPVYAQPNFAYTPTIGLVASALLSNLFVRPLYSQYYFGNYYGPTAFQSGIYPWYAYHQSRYGYDPLYAYYNVVNSRTDPGWSNRLYQDYRYRVANPEARPPITYTEQVRIVRNTTINNVRNVEVARPIQQMAAAPAQRGVPQFERVDEARRRAMAERATQLHGFREQRFQHEIEAARQHPAAELRHPHTIELSHSPIMAPPSQEHLAGERSRLAAPPPPEHPHFDRAVQPIHHDEARQLRPEPHPETRPAPRFEASRAVERAERKK
jgi:hypothetical protein